MPTLTRLLLILIGLAGAIYGSAWWLAETVKPEPRELTISIPAEQLNPETRNQ